MDFKNSLKRKATEDFSARPMKLARQELSRVEYTEICASDLTLARRCVYRERHKSWPKIPQNQEELNEFLKRAFEEKSIKTSRGELFLYRSEKGLSMFTCESNLSPPFCFEKASERAYAIDLESYRNKSPERKWLLMFSGLSCLDPRMVQEAVQRLESVMPAGEDYKTFLDYVKKTYTSPDAKFPPDVWASVPSMEPATTNGAESFHTDFNAQFNAAHPNIFASISVLLEIQAQTYVKINSLRVGEKNYVEPKRIEMKKKRIQAWNEMFSDRSLLSYLLYMGSLNAAMEIK
ncbi:Putative lipid kinase SH2167 [Frankliniella fusca]|uniref:Lipid kinase SH2167 n=1 Tax=Frankliniella fusca TaxID=407009 RepID=A0AAE1LJJ1_9NEOP|nr:Putative lipid kinase SH2167 [Frankliniella fusca]